MSIETVDALRNFDLYGRITDLFTTAESNGDLVYSEPDYVEILKDDASNMEYELKIVEALAVRPNNRAVEPGVQEKVTDDHVNEVLKKNPFLRPEPELTIVESLLDNYRLILNKYPNTKYHFLLVTKEFTPQDSLLKPIELLLVKTILDNLNGKLKSIGSRSKYFSFFNSGPESGYSQYHKHIQFMLLPEDFKVYQDDVVRNVDFYYPNEIDERKSPLFNAKCSFKHSILKLAPINTEDDVENEDNLALLYMFLIRRVLNIAKEFNIDQISYNLIIMNDWMMVVPRRSAKYENIWQNSLGFMGIFNAKNVEIKDKMIELGFPKILEECGFKTEEQEKDVMYNEYGY